MECFSLSAGLIHLLRRFKWRTANAEDSSPTVVAEGFHYASSPNEEGMRTWQGWKRRGQIACGKSHGEQKPILDILASSIEKSDFFY